MAQRSYPSEWYCAWRSLPVALMIAMLPTSNYLFIEKGDISSLQWSSASVLNTNISLKSPVKKKFHDQSNASLNFYVLLNNTSGYVSVFNKVKKVFSCKINQVGLKK